MPILSLSLLGSFYSTIGGSPLRVFRTKSVQALLIYLAVESQTGGAIQREFLAEMLYPGLPPTSSKKNLRQTLYEMRQLIAGSGTEEQPLILADRQTVALNPSWTIDLDTNRFESGAQSEELDRLEQVAGLYRGDFLSDFYLPDSKTFEGWAAMRRAYYRRLAASLFDRMAETYLAAEDYAQAEEYARRQLSLDDLNEPAGRQLMRALAGQDQRSRALAEFKGLQQRLAVELEIEPASETLDLFRGIQAGDIAPAGQPALDMAGQSTTLPAREQPLPADRPAANNLPPQPTPFVGREEELAEISRLLGDGSPTRLVTLLGPGGSGKSRLAIEAARFIARENPGTYPDGIWFVPLAALSEETAIVPEVAKSIQMVLAGEDKPREQQLMEYLSQKKLLLLLDNYEQLLVEGTQPFPADLLGCAAEVTILVTSRARLNVRGEQLLPVGGLDLPEEGLSLTEVGESIGGAIRLFAQSASRISAEFELSAQNWPVIVKICSLLEGLPLAIELAASWMEVLSPEEIVVEIDRSLNILEADWADMPSRQRSMRAIFNASWQLASQVEKHALKRLSVFRGPFGREAALAVIGADLNMLLALVNKSWLTRDKAGNYHFHELLRQFSQEALQQDDNEWRTARKEHASYFVSLLVDLGQAIRGPEQKKTLTLIEDYFENIRQAWTWLSGQREISTLTQQMLPAIFQFCTVRARGEDVVALATVAMENRAEREMDLIDAAILETAVLATTYGGYLPSFFHGLNVSLEVQADVSERVWLTFKSLDPRRLDPLWAVTSTIIYAFTSKRNRETMKQLRQLIGAYRDSQDEWGQAFAMKYLALMGSEHFVFSAEQIEPESIPASMIDGLEWDRLFLEAAQIFERLGDQLELADSLRLLGNHLHFTNPRAALEPLQRAKSLFEQLGNPIMTAQVLGTLALRSLWLGEFEESFAYFKEKRDLIEFTGNRSFLKEVYAFEAIHAARYLSIDHARELHQKNLDLLTAFNDETDKAWVLWELGNIERLAGNLELALNYFQQAHQLIERDNIVYARIFYSMGMGDYCQAIDDYMASIAHYQDSLRWAQEIGHEWAVGYGLSGLGRAYLGDKRYAEAKDQFFEALHFNQTTNYHDLTMIALAGLAALKAATNDYQAALLLATFVYQSHRSWLETKRQAKEVITRATVRLSADEVLNARRQGLSMSEDEILEMVFAEEDSEEE